MDTNKMREQFESKFQTPIGMVWCEVAQQYVKALGCICPATAITAQDQLWKCWQASREAVVVELPSEDTCRTSTSKEEAAQDAHNHALGECRSVIEAQGLKVAP